VLGSGDVHTHRERVHTHTHTHTYTPEQASCVVGIHCARLVDCDRKVPHLVITPLCLGLSRWAFGGQAARHAAVCGEHAVLTCGVYQLYSKEENLLPTTYLPHTACWKEELPATERYRGGGYHT